MYKTIIRTVGGLSHILNTSTGEIMTFEITGRDARYLARNWASPNLELDDDVRKLFSEQGQVNTRLCRPNLNGLGMEFGFPTIVNLELNRRCCLRCVHCYLGKFRLSSGEHSIFETTPWPEVEKLLDQMKSMGVFLLVLTGGEPFMNRRAKDLLEAATDKGFVTEIFSSLQTLPNWFAHGATRLVGRVQTSVYSSVDAVHDTVTTAPGSLKKTLKNLLHLRKAGVYVEVSTPLMTINYHTWRETENFFRGLEIPQSFSWPIHSEYYDETSGTAELNVSPMQFKEFITSHPDFLSSRTLQGDVSPVCGLGRVMFSITATGDVNPCSQLPVVVGNIGRQCIRAIYRSKAMQRFRDIKCCDTGLKSAYNYCLGENLVETGNLFTQSPILVAAINAAINFSEGGSQRREKDE